MGSDPPLPLVATIHVVGKSRLSGFCGSVIRAESQLFLRQLGVEVGFGDICSYMEQMGAHMKRR